MPNEDAASFDFVIAPLVIHYLENLSELFKDVCRVLKKDGQFIFSTNHPHVDFRNSPTGNYFLTEKLTEDWHTLGRPVEVNYYRRPISAFASEIAKAGMVIVDISEGIGTDELKEASEKLYNKLTTKPNFMFYICKPDR